MTAKQCVTEISRLDVLPSPFGADRRALKTDLIRTLGAHARNENHATLIVQHILDTMTVFPTRAELIAISGEVHVNSDGLPAPCPECRPTHGFWVHEEINGFSCARRCTCARGQALKVKDRATGWPT